MPNKQGGIFHYIALTAGIFLFVFSLASVSQAQSGPKSCAVNGDCAAGQYCVAGKCNLPPPIWNTKFITGDLPQDARIDLSGAAASWRLRADDLQLGFGNQINNTAGGEVAINYSGAGAVGKGFTVYDGATNSLFRVDAQGDVTITQKLKATGGASITGNLGIGTTAPQSPLTIYSPSPSAWNLFSLDTAGTGANDQAQMTFVTKGNGNTVLSGANTLGWSLGARGDAFSAQEQRNDLMLYYWGGNSWYHIMSFDSSQKRVGIGTTNPGYKLSVVDTGTTPVINIWNNSATLQWTGARLARGGTIEGNEKWFIGMNGTDDSLRLRRNASTDDLVITSLGNVGIGTASPGTKLEVVGQIKVTGGAPAAGKILTSDAVGLASWQTPASGLPSGTAGQTLRNNGATWVADSNLFNNGTNVGIGTAAPGAKLEVAGDLKVSGCFGPVFQGTTSVSYDGNNNGYNGANSLCQNVFSGSHVCATGEILNSVNCSSATVLGASGFAWISNGPPAYLAQANDCSGRASNASDVYGTMWEFSTTGGKGHLTGCNTLRKFACCK